MNDGVIKSNDPARWRGRFRYASYRLQLAWILWMVVSHTSCWTQASSARLDDRAWVIVLSLSVPTVLLLLAMARFGEGDLISQVGPQTGFSLEVTILGGAETFDGPDGLGPCHAAVRCAAASRSAPGIRARVPPLIGRVEVGKYMEFDPGDSETPRREAKQPLQLGRVVIIDLGYPETVTLRSAGGHLPRSRAGRWRLLLHWPFRVPEARDVWGCFREGDRIVLEDVVDVQIDGSPSWVGSHAGFRDAPVPRITRDPRYPLTATLPPVIAYGGEANRSRERLVGDVISALLLFFNWMLIATVTLVACSLDPESAVYVPRWAACVPAVLLTALLIHRRLRWRRYRTAWPWNERFDATIDGSRPSPPH